MKKKRYLTMILSLAILLAAAGYYLLAPWGFAYNVPAVEAVLRLELVRAGERWLGTNEADGSHLTIVERYNAQEPLPVGYTLQASDSWCAAFVTVSAMDAGLTEIIPPECGCQRQIGLFQDRGRWVEDDWYLPAPGDIVYYDWDQKKPGECTGWSDHVGIVTGVKWPFIRVLEGNRDDRVTYRTIVVGDLQVRGYGVPDYTAAIK